MRDGKTMDVATINGVKKLLQTIETAIQKEKPIRTTELFDNVFYAPTVWRSASEPMHQDLHRREDNFNELTKINASTTVSEVIQAYLQLRFSGVPADQHPNTVVSSGNKYELAGFEQALRMQHINIHERRVYAPAPRRDQRRSAYAASEEPQAEPAPPHLIADEGEEMAPSPPELADEDDDATSETQGFGIYMAELGLDMEAIDDEDIPVLAAEFQKRQTARKHMAKKHPPRGQPRKGRNLAEDDKKKKERRDRIQAPKARTKCDKCHEVRHCAGDPQCKLSKHKPLTRGAPRPKGPSCPRHSGFCSGDTSVYFSVADIQDDAPAMVADFNECIHIFDPASKYIVRQGNGVARGFRCSKCKQMAVQTHRQGAEDRWGYLFMAAM